MSLINHEFAPLIARLQAEDAVIRRVALLELADLAEAEALPWIIERLAQDSSEQVRTEAARALAGWDDTEVVQALAEALSDPATEVRQAAADSLTELKQASSGEPLLAWLDHADPFVVSSVLRALRELRLPAAALPAQAALQASDERVRREAVSLLGWLKYQPAAASLAQLALTDANLEIRKVATGALGFSHTPETSHSLIQALSDTAWQVREEAANTLGKLAVPTALPSLIQALDDAYWQVRLQATRALAKLKNRQASPAIGDLLQHPISNLRKEAALALGEIADPASLVLLEAAATDADPEVRKAVRIALNQLTLAAKP